MERQRSDHAGCSLERDFAGAFVVQLTTLLKAKRAARARAPRTGRARRGARPPAS